MALASDLKKPRPWVFNPHLVAPEWRWFWRAKSAFLFADGPSGVISGAQEIYDYVARKYRSVIDDNGASSNRFATEIGPCWLACRTSPSDRGLALETDCLNGSTSFTILAYIKGPFSDSTLDTTNPHTIYDEWESGGRNVLWRYRPQENNIDGFVYTTAQTGGQFSSASDIDDGKFHAVALRYDGSSLELFTDGVIDSTSFSPSGTIGEASAGENGARLSGEVFANTNGGQFLWGCAAVFRDIALADGEIRAWSNDPFGPFRMDDEQPVLPTAAASSVPVYLYHQRHHNRAA